jgi:hypothetical protein
VPNVCASYRLDFASGAWRQVGVLGRDAFMQLTNALRTIAAEAPRSAGERDQGADKRGRLACGDVAAIYEVHHDTCTIYVVAVEMSGRGTGDPDRPAV